MLMIGSVIASRRAEQENLGDTYGGYDAHEERVRVLEADRDALRLERLHAAEEAAGRGSSAWDEERGEFGDITEADYGAEEGAGSDGSGSDMDLESESEDDDEEQRRRQQEERDYGEADMDIERESDSDDE